MKYLIFDLAGVLFEYVAADCLIPLSEGVDLLQDCMRKGHIIFACTNCSDQSISFLHQKYPQIMESFKAVITPTVANARKPNPKIFEYLLKTYQLPVENTFFIDDDSTNVQAARGLGIQGFQAHDLKELRKELKAWNLI